jgi:diguanylate cyclase (GGDEF)-like protein
VQCAGALPAVWQPETPETVGAVEARPRAFWRSLLPYILIVAAGVLLLYTWRIQANPNLEGGLYIGATLLLGLVLLRQVIALRENAQLNRSLRAAYRTVETRNRESMAYAEQLEQLNRALHGTQTELIASNQALTTANACLEALATTDSMTGLANHRAFQERLREELSDARRHDRSLALLLLDVDNFKDYNDTYGHPAGDEVLCMLARLLQATVRASDFVARYGGEEFAVLLPQTDTNTALKIAERIRAAVALHAFPRRPMTISIGVALQQGARMAGEDLVLSADRALYAAKRAERNRVMLASDLLLEAAANEGADDQRWEDAADEPGDHLAEWNSIETLLQEPAGQILSGLLAALDLRDAETEGHSQRVVRFALRLAQEIGALDLATITPGDMRELAYGALLHDIGKLGIPDSVLRKPGPLDAGEIQQMRHHPLLGAHLIANFVLLAPALPVVRFHHERWDGGGYPNGLAGTEIPLAARIFALADTFDAMSSDRPYRAALPYPIIRAEIERLAGTQFDPNLIRAFLSVPEADWESLRYVEPAAALSIKASDEFLLEAA